MKTSQTPVGQRKSIQIVLRWIIGIGLAFLVGERVWRWQTYIPIVETVKVNREPLWTSYTAEGLVKGTDYVIGSEFGGRVVDVLIQEGDHVTKGQVLIRLNSEVVQMSELEARASLSAAIKDAERLQAERELLAEQQKASHRSAQARLRQAEYGHERLLKGARPEEILQAEQRVNKNSATVLEAEQNLRRTSALYEAGASSRASLEKAQSLHKAATAELLAAEAAARLLRLGPSQEDIRVSEAGVKAAQADLNLLDSGIGRVKVAEMALASGNALVQRARAALARAKISLSEHVILAAADGTITKLACERGAILTLGSPALTISTRNELRVEAEISTEDVAKLNPGDEVVITCATYPGRKFPARIRSVMPAGELKPDAAIRTRIVRARIDLLGNQNLFRPGMEVDVEGGQRLDNRICVPTDAIRFTGATATILRIENGKVVEIPVKTGAQSADLTEITHGVQVGQTLIVRGKDEIKPGDVVRGVPRG